MEVFEELDERILVVGTGPHIEDEPGVGAVGGEADGGGHRETLPAEAVLEHGGATPGRPGRPHRGEEAEPALVLETDPGFPASGVFFTRGHSFFTHCDRLVIALHRSACRALTGPTHLAQDPPYVARVVGSPTASITSATPVASTFGGVTVFEGALFELSLDTAQIRLVELGESAGPTPPAE